MLLDRKSLGWLFQKPEAISKQDFISMLDVQKLSTQEEAVRLAGLLFAKKLKLNVSDIEDYAIGFKLAGTKLFMFGKAERQIFAFEKSTSGLSENERARLLMLSD
jgi:hypothetical protein